MSDPRARKVLTDDPYVDLNPVPFFNRKLCDAMARRQFQPVLNGEHGCNTTAEYVEQGNQVRKVSFH